ncbi:MAG: Uma2 family endonuclease [Spirosomaceae bacterium]|jgi:Uma2 family endonuclease|nr:Uma2 family endonuclease [Spirosomataceae bacterium]
MTALAERILKRPDAVQLLKKVQQTLDDEARRRRDFREWIDEQMKAEFINGEIVVHSPVKKKHWEASSFLSTLLSVHTTLKRLGRVGVEKVMISLTRNDYEPDIVFFSSEKSALFTKDQMFFPAPDFVVEILSKKTAAKDRGIKKQDYALHGIKEYWIIDPERQRIEQYLLLSDKDSVYFEPYVYTIDDDISSRAVEGFVVPVRAIFEAEANAQALADLTRK